MIRGLIAVLCVACAACSTPASSARFTERAPDRASFPLVAQTLEHHCGTLDCHGSTFRNLRVYGNESLRYAGSDRPLAPPCTTTREVDEDFDSLVGLEPEAVTAVASGLADPGSLTLVRKARGTEAHKGGALQNVGDDLDVCMTAWLVGQPNDDACSRVAPATLPPPPAGQPPPCEPGP